MSVIKDAVDRVIDLECNHFEDEVPCMQAANMAIKYDVNYDMNNEDSSGFRMVQSIYKEESSVHGELNNLIKQGKEYVIMLYTWRSCSRALPTGKDTEMNNNIRQKTVEVLDSSIKNLKKFKQFSEDIVQRFCKEVETLSKRKSNEGFISESYMLAMCNMLKIIALLDEMKNMKASMKNDHTLYKRAAELLKTIDNTDTDHTMFLAQQNIIRTALKNTLIKINGFEEFLLDLINICVNMYVNKMYIFPEEKHTFVLVIAFSIYLMDTEKENVSVNINKIRKLKINQIDQIFKECEVVNVFGDMSIYPFSFVESTPHFDRSKWPENSGLKISSQGVLLDHINQFRSEYTSLTAELASYSNFNVVSQKEGSNENLKSAYDLALKSIQFLSKWTTQIIDTFSWKLGHPAVDPSVPSEAEDYEKATRYNYSSQEKFALIEVIAMIKTIQNQLNRLESHFSDTVVSHIYLELQIFLNVTLPEICGKISKSKQLLLCILQSLWAVGLDKKENYLEMILDKSKGKTNAVELANLITTSKNAIVAKNVPPRSTQLYLIRCIIENLIQTRVKNNYKKDLKDHIKALDDLYKKSFYWSYMLNFRETLDVCCDLSQMWYREFFLELTNGKRIQFPIETSIPCILTNHILDTQDQAYMEYLLYPLDLYNDSAVCALKKFKRQFLYNEIEAEVNFMMIQLIVRLSDQIFLCFKQLCSNMLLNKRFKNQLINCGGQNLLNPPVSRYITLMKQRHLQLLGRSFNMNKLIAHRINKSVYESLETAVKRFKRTGITYILEFDCLIDVNRLTHKYLSQYLELDSFDSMLTEIVQSTSSTFGIISSFIINELKDVICQNFNYNSKTDRFYPLKEVFREISSDTVHDRVEHLWGNKYLNSSFECIFKLYSAYFGKEHLVKICQLIGYDGVYWLLIELEKATDFVLKNELQDFISHIISIMPSNVSRRLDGKTSVEQIKILLEELKNLLNNKHITTNIANSFHKFGNYVLLLIKLENNMFVHEGLEFKETFPFIEIYPKVFVPQNDSNTTEEFECKKLKSKYQVFNVYNMMSKIGTPEQSEIAKQQLDLTKERLCYNRSFFTNFLTNLQSKLLNYTVKDEYDIEINFWTQRHDNNYSRNSDYNDKDFYMVWSSIVFIFSTAKSEILYGEELYWGGCTIMALLNQQRLFEWQNVCGKLARSHKLKRDTKNETELDHVISRIKRILQIHDQSFAVLNRYLAIKDDYLYMKSSLTHMDPNESNLTISHSAEIDGTDDEFDD